MPLRRKSNKKASSRDSEQAQLPSTELPQQVPVEPVYKDEIQVREFPLLKEQERLATFWATEEENEPIGWEETEELDYTKVAASLGISPLPELELLPTVLQNSERPSLKDYEAVDENLTSFKTIFPREQDTHSQFNYAQSSVYPVHQLGKISLISREWIQQNDPNSILKLTEHAQSKGILPWTIQSGSERLLVLSKYGMKVTDIKNERVYARHTLHNIIGVVHFIDVRGQSLLAIKTNDDNRLFNLYIYQCQNEDQTTDICMMLTQIFDAVLSKTKLENNLIALK